MKIFFPKEPDNELRTPIVPLIVQKFRSLEFDVLVEKGIGETVSLNDDVYLKAGAKVIKNRVEAFSSADIVCRLNVPNIEETQHLKHNSIHISFLDPFNQRELIDAFAKQSVTAISMEMVPRVTRAQKMDALSSQASLAGYSAVIEAAEKLNKVFPMMMTPAGTVSPAKVFVVGVGVAGLQAIATAKRLGARVEAFDTRPTVEEQVLSLGAKFVKIDIGQLEETEQGYAKELNAEQLELQRQGMIKACGYSDVIITTAQVFGKKAPLIITQDMIDAMQPGSIIIDMAVSTGGNVEGSVAGKTVISNGVIIIGNEHLPASVAAHASQVYANNLYSMVEEFWDKENKIMNIDINDEILSGCVVSHSGESIDPLSK